MQIICTKFHTHSEGGQSYTMAPRDRTADPRLVHGHRRTLIRVDLGRPQLLPNYRSHGTVVLHLQRKLQMICRELKPGPSQSSTPPLPFSGNLHRAEALRKAEVQVGKKAERRDSNDKFTEHRFACLFSVFPQENINSCELEPYLPCATAISLHPADCPTHCMPLINIC